LRDLLVSQTFGDEGQDLCLTWTQMHQRYPRNQILSMKIIIVKS
jgi:hypothetical protein